jgi:hypothetical protein
VSSIPPYPLHWPEGHPRTPPEKRLTSQFKTTLAGAVKNVADSLRKFGTDSGQPVKNIVATTNVGGINLSASEPKDSGVAVWFEWDGATRCIAVDRHRKPEENLQAIHHILEARRTEVRHGGIVIARTAFRGFIALAAPGAKPWWDVMGVKRDATLDEINAAYRTRANVAHPDNGGTHEAMTELNAARAAALRERGANQ